MSNFFEDVSKNATQVEEELLGPNYKYYSKIKTPSELGMSSRGSFGALSSNISGLINYAEVLVTGNSRASKTGGPLGPQFFLKTGQQCKAKDTGKMTTRYIYMDQKPNGNIPFISAGLGTNFSEFRGLIPGTFGNLNALNPMAIFSSFTEGSNPECQQLEMETTPTSINNYQSKQSEYVTINDISNMDACSFTLSGKRNPVTGNRCNEAFTNMKEIDDTDILVKVFYGSLGIFGLYLLCKFMEKNKNLKF